jgi:hypothetical protein
VIKRFSAGLPPASAGFPSGRYHITSSSLCMLQFASWSVNVADFEHHPPFRPTTVGFNSSILKLLSVLQFGGHHGLQNYTSDLPPNELTVYTWPDATLRELTDLVKSAQPAARRQNVRLEFAFVYPDAKGRNTMRPVQPLTPGNPIIKSLDNEFICSTINLFGGCP